MLLGRSILHTPELLFLDEPTSGIDPGSSEEVHRFINTIRNQGTTVFLTTHNMEEADLLCDEIAFINNGVIVAADSPKALKSRFGKNDIEISYIENGITKIKIFSMEEKNIFTKIGEIHQNGQVLSVHSKEATMKDVFLSVIDNSKGNQ